MFCAVLYNLYIMYFYYVYEFLLLRMFRSVYSVSMCCTLYCIVCKCVLHCTVLISPYPTRKETSYSDQTRDLFNTLPTKLNTLLSPLL